MGSTIRRDELPPEIEDAIYAVLDMSSAERPAAIAAFVAEHPGWRAALEGALRDAAAAATIGDAGDVTAETLARLDRLRARRDGASRYVDAGEIGRGGMGVVRRVRDVDLERDLAMKLVRERPGQAVDDAFVIGRFLDEALITGQLQHPNVVPLHDLGIDAAGRPWFTMRFVSGITAEVAFAAAHAERDGWTLSRALEVLLKVGDAIAFAHARGVVHRDLKPANVMVGEFGEVYVMDWGLAKLVDGPERCDLRIRTPSSADGESPLVTMDGTVVGTPCFMAPEQALGQIDRVGPAADVYALGALLYQLLTGTRPYVQPGTRPPQNALLDAVRAGPPEPVERLAPAAPAELVAICAKAMARRIELRYPTVREFAEDVRRYLDARVVRAHRTGPFAELRAWVRRNRALAAALGVLVVVLIVSAWTIGAMAQRATHDAAVQAATQRDLLALGSAAREVERDPARAAAILAAVPADTTQSADAMQVAFDALASLPDGHRLDAVFDLGPTAVQPLCISDDGRRVIAGSGGSTWVGALESSSSGVTTLGRFDGDVDSLLSRVGSADGGRVALFDAEGVHVVDVASGVVSTLPRVGVSSAVFDPRGERVLVASEALALDVWTPTPDRGGVQRLPIPAPFALSAGFDVSGRHVAVALADGEVLAFDLENATAVRTLDTPRGELAWLAFAAAAPVLVGATADGVLCAWDLADAGRARVTWQHPAPLVAFGCSADGGIVVTASTDGGVRLASRNDGAVLDHWQVDGRVRDLAVTADARAVALGLDDGRVVVLTRGSERRAVLRGHRGGVRRVRFDPLATRLVSAGDDGTVRVWRREPAAWPEFAGARACAWRPGGGGFACATPRVGVVLVAPDGTQTVVPGTTGTVARALRFDPSGGVLAVLDTTGLARVLDVPSGRERFRVTDVRGLSGAVDGAFRLLGADGAIRTWSLDGERNATSAAHGDGPCVVDGDVVCTVAHGGDVQIGMDVTWSVRGVIADLDVVARGGCVAARTTDGVVWIRSRGDIGAHVFRLAPPVPIVAMQLASDRERLLTVDEHGVVRAWPLRWDEVREQIGRAATRFVATGPR